MRTESYRWNYINDDICDMKERYGIKMGNNTIPSSVSVKCWLTKKKNTHNLLFLIKSKIPCQKTFGTKFPQLPDVLALCWSLCCWWWCGG